MSSLGTGLIVRATLLVIIKEIVSSKLCLSEQFVVKQVGSGWKATNERSRTTAMDEPRPDDQRSEQQRSEQFVSIPFD